MIYSPQGHGPRAQAKLNDDWTRAGRWLNSMKNGFRWKDSDSALGT